MKTKFKDYTNEILIFMTTVFLVGAMALEFYKYQTGT